MNKMLNNEQSLAYADNRDGYDQSINPTAAPQINNIEALEQQIAMVKERIARNKRALVDMKGVTDRISSLEFKKINSTDPSTIWRWKEQQKDMREANEQVKSNTANKFVNEVEAVLKTSISPEYAEQVQLLSNVRNKIAEGKTLGYDVSGLEVMEKKIQDKVGKTIGNTEKVNATRDDLKNLDKRLAEKTITPAQYKSSVNELQGRDFDDYELRNELNTKSMSGSKKENAAATYKKYMAGLKAYTKSSQGRDYDTLPDKLKEQAKRSYDTYLAQQKR